MSFQASGTAGANKKTSAERSQLSARVEKTAELTSEIQREVREVTERVCSVKAVKALEEKADDISDQILETRQAFQQWRREVLSNSPTPTNTLYCRKVEGLLKDQEASMEESRTTLSLLETQCPRENQSSREKASKAAAREGSIANWSPAVSEHSKTTTPETPPVSLPRLLLLRQDKGINENHQFWTMECNWW